MVKRYVEELSKEELKEVFNANEKLQNEVLEDMMESEMYWIGEQLDYIRSSLSDWSIGDDRHNYIKVDDSDRFIEGLIEMDESMPLFTDKDKGIIYKMAEMRDEFFEKDCDDEDFDRAENEFEDAVEGLAKEVVAQFQKRVEGCYDDENQLSYFLDFYADERMNEKSFYIDTEDEDLELFENVSYTKSYK